MGYLTHGATACGKTYDLLPCPFCGGEAVFHDYTGKAVEVALANRCDVPAMIRCERCGAMVSFNTGGRSTRRDAADAWNRRAERTCRDTDYDTESITCSECSETTRNTLFWVDVDGGRTVNGHRPRFCSNCGARVVGCDDA